MFIEVNCAFCNQLHKKNKHEVSRCLREGTKMFCSRDCIVKYRAKNKIPKAPNVVCAYCHKEFYMNKTKQKNSRTGFRFCCREHKDIAQRIGGIKEIQPSHYGTILKDYRTLIQRNDLLKECNRCNYKEVIEVLQVHHRDRNRNNNDLKNLEVLCPTCHAAEHFRAKDGLYGRK
jgi:Zn finger protein HypA/HybF involved in hydrogenase expression